MFSFKTIPILLSLLLLAVSACSQSKKAQSTTAASPSKFKNVLIDKAEKGDLYGPCEPSICVNPTNTKNIAQVPKASGKSQRTAKMKWIKAKPCCDKPATNARLPERKKLFLGM